MQSLYFAYGSNLSSARLLARVASARPLAPAQLLGWSLRTNKRGRDGSGKANLRSEARECVWGALYSMDPDAWPALDACEEGYARVSVEVLTHQDSLQASTYVSERLTADPVPFSWYKQLIVDGAREHGLPEDWVRLLEALPARPDPRLS